MKMNDAFPGSFLKCADLNGRKVPVTIDRCAVEKIGDDQKPVVYFRKTEKALVLNKTNFASIVEITGREDSDDWSGCRVSLVPAKTDYQGKRVDCVRIEMPPAAQRAPEPEPVEEEVPELDEDSIPFAWLVPLMVTGLSFMA